jgi:NADH-quinone oxidoreductase subunit J
VVAVLVIFEIGSVVWLKSAGVLRETTMTPLPADYSNTEALGELLYTEYVYPFQLAAVILLVAIVAAIVLTMRHRAGLKVQNVARQVAVRARDRIRIVKMDPEERG